MNCLYITLFFKIVAGIVQTFIKSWNQLLYPRIIEVCRQPFKPRHDFFLHLIIVLDLFPSEMFLHFVTFCPFITLPQKTTTFLWISAGRSTFALRNHMTERTSHLAGLWIGAAISKRLTQTKPVLPLSKDQGGSQVRDQGRRQFCYNKHKKCPYRPTRDVSLLSGYASYVIFDATCDLFYSCLQHSTKIKKNINVWQCGSTLIKWLLNSFIYNKPVIVFVTSVRIYI